MKHIVRRLTALALALTLLAGCAGGGGQGSADPIALGETMTAAATALPAMSLMTSGHERGEELFPYLSDMDYAKVDGYYFAYAEAGTAEEIAVIRLRDAADADEAAASLARHVQDRVGIFSVYEPEQVPMAEDAQIIIAGNLVALIICANPDGVAAVFRRGVE